MKYNLPRKYLSYSAYKLWCSSPTGFRKRYYLNETPFRTPQTEFGKLVGQMIEDNDRKHHAILEEIINYPIKEHKIEVEYEGLPLLGFLDQFNPEDLAIMEMKTGHRNKKGVCPWDRLKVRKHEQLVFYCMLVELSEGRYNPKTILQWLETRHREEKAHKGGRVRLGDEAGIELTGEIETFERNIEQWEVDKMKEKVLQVAQEISDDYTEWQKEH